MCIRDSYHALLPEINGLYHKGILSARLFDIAESVENYVLFGMALKNRKDVYKRQGQQEQADGRTLSFVSYLSSALHVPNGDSAGK